MSWLGEHHLYAVAPLARGHVDASAHGRAVERIQCVFKPFKRPLALLQRRLRLGVGHHGVLCAFVHIDEERAVELLLAVVERLRRSPEVLALRHLYGDGRLACGVYRQLLPHRAAVEPFVAARYVPHANDVVGQSVQTVVHHILCPVVFRVYRSVGELVCGVLHCVFSLLGSGHRRVGRYLAVHAVVNIAVEERRAEACARASFTATDDELDVPLAIM